MAAVVLAALPGVATLRLVGPSEGADEVLPPLAACRLFAFLLGLSDGANQLAIPDGLAWRIGRSLARREGVAVVAGGNGRGPLPSQLDTPFGLFVAEGTADVYVSDTRNHRVQLWPCGATEGRTVAGGNGLGRRDHQLNCPAGIHLHEGTVFVADSRNHRIVAWPPGAGKGTVVAGTGRPGDGLHQLNEPNGVHVLANGDLVIADTHNSRVLLWPAGAKGGALVLSDRVLRFPSGVWASTSSRSEAGLGPELVVADSSNDRVIRCLLPCGGNLTTVLGKGYPLPGGPPFGLPFAAVRLPDGACVAADSEHHQVVLCPPPSGGPIGTSGPPEVILRLVPTPADPHFSHPSAVAVQGSDLYVCDQGNCRVLLASLPSY